MDLYFLRHAIAVPRGTPGYEDAKRPLTPEGKAKLEKIARGIKKLGLSFDTILSSPFLRAKDTAKQVAARLRLSRKLNFEPTLSAEGSPASFVRVLQNEYKGVKSLLVVGHEPYLTSLISILITGKPGAAILLKKGGLCKLTIEQELRYGLCATLNWLITPRQLIKL